LKRDRQTEILKLIHENEIETQEELVEKLKEKGFDVTQATVSRDIRELKLMKVAGDSGRQRYALLQNQTPGTAGRYVRVLREACQSIEPAGNLIVVKTAPGMAMAAAAAMDELDWNEVVGSIAGDNTIFCAVRSTDQAPIVAERLGNIIRQKEE
jgi:transcriptional regulator of arginine metabolism